MWYVYTVSICAYGNFFIGLGSINFIIHPVKFSVIWPGDFQSCYHLYKKKTTVNCTYKGACLQHTISAPTISLSEEFGLSRESFWDLAIFLYLKFVYRLPLYTVWVINHWKDHSTALVSVFIFNPENGHSFNLDSKLRVGLKRLVEIVDKYVCCRIVSFNLLFGNRKPFCWFFFF